MIFYHTRGIWARGIFKVQSSRFKVGAKESGSSAPLSGPISYFIIHPSSLGAEGRKAGRREGREAGMPERGPPDSGKAGLPDRQTAGKPECRKAGMREGGRRESRESGICSCHGAMPLHAL